MFVFFADCFIKKNTQGQKRKWKLVCLDLVVVSVVGQYHSFLLTWVCKDTNCSLWMMEAFQVLRNKINAMLILSTYHEKRTCFLWFNTVAQFWTLKTHICRIAIVSPHLWNQGTQEWHRWEAIMISLYNGRLAHPVICLNKTYVSSTI